jgi:hypothetical protein
MLHWACVAYFLLFRLKTGNMPPEDLPFEETQNKTVATFGTLGRKKSKSLFEDFQEEENIFPKKCQITENINLLESKINNGNMIKD